MLNFADFANPSGLQFNGNADNVNNVLRLTPPERGQAGSVFTTAPIALAPDASFSTHF